MEKDHGNSGVKGMDLIKLAQMLCIDYPSYILSEILNLLDKREDDNVDFDEFLGGIRMILLFDSYFDEMEQLYKYLDPGQKSGKIKKDDFVKAASKLNVSKVDLRVPQEEDIEQAYSTMTVEEEGYLNYDEFLILLFKCTQDDAANSSYK